MARRVRARWDTAQASTVVIGNLELPVGDDARLPDGSAGPAPTEMLLASIASCFAISLAWVAAKRGLELPGLAVDVTGDYDGPRLATIGITVAADADPAVIDELIPRAQRVCYVTNTLRQPPHITVSRDAT